MIYLDNNATTQCAPEVIEAMKPYWDVEYGNPASVHIAGRMAKKIVDIARNNVASLANCKPSEIFFTSGATESNNLLFLGLLLKKQTNRNRILISSIEHKSILEPAKFLAQRGFKVDLIPVTSQGIINLDKARKLITNDTALVSVQAANNEIGTIQPITEISTLTHQVGSLFHTDSAQALGKIPVDLRIWDCDFASFSSHKLYGPKGVGALYVKGGIRSWTWAYPLNGGGQERGLIPGTLNVPGIVGFGKACEMSQGVLKEDIIRISNMRSLFENKLSNIDFPFMIHGKDVERLPGTSSIAFFNIPADILIDNLGILSIGHASACASGALEPSHVISALGYDDKIADSTIRISIGRYTTIEMLDVAYELINKSIQDIKNKFIRRENDT
jgi:cysteine desulfurase